MKQYLSVSKGKQFQPTILYSAKRLVKYKSQTEIFSDMQDLKMFASRVPFLRKILEGMLLESEREREVGLRRQVMPQQSLDDGDGRTLICSGTWGATIQAEGKTKQMLPDALEHIRKICLV